MSEASAAFSRILLNEIRIVRRQPVGLLFSLGLPLLLLVILGAVPALHTPMQSLGGRTYLYVALPTLIDLVIAIIGIVNLPSPLVADRDQGILRRLSTTPAKPEWVLGAQLLVHVGVAIAGLGVLMIVGILALDLEVPRSPLGFCASIFLSIGALFAIGLWIAAVARTSAAAKGVSLVVLFPMLFFGGVWIPREMMSRVLREIGDFTPLGASVSAIRASLDGPFPSIEPLGVLAAYAVVFGLLARKSFKWE